MQRIERIAGAESTGAERYFNYMNRGRERVSVTTFKLIIGVTVY